MTDEDWEWLRHIKTEEEWCSCDSPQPLLIYLKRKASNRKFRLYAVACARLIWSHLLHRESQLAIETAERFADGQADEEDRETCEKAADDAVERIADDEAGDTAYHAALSAVWCARSFSPDDPYETGHAAFYAASTLDTRKPFVAILHCVFGNPFRPRARLPRTVRAWNDGTIPKLAQGIYDERIMPNGELEVAHLGVLADALDDAGCTDADILGHLRGPGPHVRGCWVLDLILGKG